MNGYKRYTAYKLAPNRIAGGRIIGARCCARLLAPGDPASRVENRVADSTANPYFALAFQILSGLDGLENGLTPPPPLANPYGDDAELLPRSLLAAIERFEGSEMYRAALGDEFVSYLHPAQARRMGPLPHDRLRLGARGVLHRLLTRSGRWFASSAEP